MKVYYAHCMAIYGTPQEARDIATLEALGLTVVNPNTPECDAGYIAQGMDYFKRFVTECDAIAFRAVPDGRIPAGIWREIQMFRESPGVSKPVIELPSSIWERGMSPDATREYLKEIGQR